MRTLNESGRSSSRYRYVYCLISTRKKCFLKLRGIDDAEIDIIQFRDISAVVSESITKKYEILDDGLSHEKVVEAIQQNYCVLPMGFGQISTEQDIKAFINKNYSHLKHMFSELEGKKELGIKVMWRMDHLLREILTSRSRINHLHKKIASLPEAAAYNYRIEMGKIVEENIQKKGEKIASDIIRQLKTHSDKYCQNPNLTGEMLLNVVFLVKKESESSFDQVVDAIEKKYGNLVEIRYTTSPPYDFADLRIKK